MFSSFLLDRAKLFEVRIDEYVSGSTIVQCYAQELIFFTKRSRNKRFEDYCAHSVSLYSSLMQPRATTDTKERR